MNMLLRNLVALVFVICLSESQVNANTIHIHYGNKHFDIGYIEIIIRENLIEVKNIYKDKVNVFNEKITEKDFDLWKEEIISLNKNLKKFTPNKKLLPDEAIYFFDLDVSNEKIEFNLSFSSLRELDDENFFNKSLTRLTRSVMEKGRKSQPMQEDRPESGD